MSDEDAFWNLPMDRLEDQRRMVADVMGPEFRVSEAIVVDVKDDGTLVGEPMVAPADHSVDRAGPERTRIVFTIFHGTKKQQLLEALFRMALMVEHHWGEITGPLACSFKVHAEYPPGTGPQGPASGPIKGNGTHR